MHVSTRPRAAIVKAIAATQKRRGRGHSGATRNSHRALLRRERNACQASELTQGDHIRHRQCSSLSAFDKALGRCSCEPAGGNRLTLPRERHHLTGSPIAHADTPGVTADVRRTSEQWRECRQGSDDPECGGGRTGVDRQPGTHRDVHAPPCKQIVREVRPQMSSLATSRSRQASPGPQVDNRVGFWRGVQCRSGKARCPGDGSGPVRLASSEQNSYIDIVPRDRLQCVNEHRAGTRCYAGSEQDCSVSRNACSECAQVGRCRRYVHECSRSHRKLYSARFQPARIDHDIDPPSRLSESLSPHGCGCIDRQVILCRAAARAAHSMPSRSEFVHSSGTYCSAATQDERLHCSSAACATELLV